MLFTAFTVEASWRGPCVRCVPWLALSAVCFGDGSGVWGPSHPIDAVSGQNVARFLKLFSGWRGGDSVGEAVNGAEHTEAPPRVSRGWRPNLAFPTHFQQLAHSLPAWQALSSVPRAQRSSPPASLGARPFHPFDSTVRDFCDFSASEDAKGIKITHGEIEIRRSVTM